MDPQRMNQDQVRWTVLKWVQGFHPAAAEDQLPRNLSEFQNAMDRDFCADRCSGLHHCETHGLIAKPVYAPTYGKYTIGLEFCSMNITEQKQAQITRSIESSGIPERFRAASFDNYTVVGVAGNVGIAKSLAQECADKDFSLILGGAPGTGKTHLACAMAKVQLSKGKSVVFIPVISLLNDIKKSFGDGKNTSAIMEAMKTAGFVILDDLGAQKDTEWSTEYLFGLIDDRYIAKRPTVITTNAENIEQLAKMAGSRGLQICGRLRENGHEHWMRGCKDFRSRVRQGNLGL